MTRRIAAVAAVVSLSTTVVAACTPHQIETFHSLTPGQQNAVVKHLSRPAGVGRFLECVKHHESRGDYRAQNPHSSASGAYQFIRSTWRNVSRSAGHPGYPTAASAPAWVQDAVAVHTLRTVGRSPWAGTGC